MNLPKILRRILIFKKEDPLFFTSIVFNISFHIILLFIIGNFWDFPEIYNAGLKLLDLQNPYTSEFPWFWMTDKYPPVFFYYYSINLFIFGKNIFALKFSFFIFNEFTIYFVYKLVTLIFNRKTGKITTILYMYSPVTIFFLLYTYNDIFTIFTIISTLYYVAKKRWIIASILLSLGISFKLVPLFVFFGIFTYSVLFCIRTIIDHKNYGKITQNIKILLKMVILIFCFSFLFALPFIILDSSAFFQSIFGFNERFVAMSINPIIPIFSIEIINIFGIFTLSSGMVFFFIFYIFLLTYLTIKHVNFTFFNMLSLIGIILLTTLFIYPSLNPRIYYWINFIVCFQFGRKLSLKSKLESKKFNKLRFLKVNLIIGIIFLSLLLYTNITFPYHIWNNPTVLENLHFGFHPENAIQTRRYTSAIIITITIYLLLFFILIQSFIKLENQMISTIIMIFLGSVIPVFYGLILQLNFVDFQSYMSTNFIITLTVFIIMIIIWIKLVYYNLKEIDYTSNKFVQWSLS